jgi:long-chain acyl-CoA synthetase
MVTVINKLTVTGDDAEFIRVISGITEYMRAQPGFIEHALYRSRNNPNVFVETARWDKAESHRAAMQGDRFRECVSALRGLAQPEPDVFEQVEEAATTH